MGRGETKARIKRRKRKKPPHFATTYCAGRPRPRFTSTTGPLPPPDLLREYGEIVPNSPERIIRMMEDEAKHRRTI